MHYKTDVLNPGVMKWLSKGDSKANKVMSAAITLRGKKTREWYSVFRVSGSTKGKGDDSEEPSSL